MGGLGLGNFLKSRPSEINFKRNFILQRDTYKMHNNSSVGNFYMLILYLLSLKLNEVFNSQPRIKSS